MSNTNQSNPKTKKEVERLQFKDVITSLKEEKHGFSPQLFWFVFFTLLSLILAYIFPYSLIITLPLVIVPSWFAFNSVTCIKGVKNSENINFFVMFKSYFSPLFFGGYRILLGFLKGLATYVGVSSISFTVYSQVALNKNAEYQAIMEQMNNPTDIAELMNDLNEFMMSETMVKPIFLITSIGLLLGIAVFLQHVLKHSMKMRRNLFTRSPMPMRQFHLVDRKVRKDNRGLLWASYLASSWFIQVLVILSAASGVVIGYFLLRDFDPIKAVIISVFIGFVLLIPLFNYISMMQNMLYLSLRHKYEETFVNMTLEFLTKFKDKLGIEEEEAKKIEAILNETKKATEEEKKTIEEEDNNSEEK
ncbi:MAG: hypothetical protein IKP50_02075 [Bacilli bacterium]|nr:hypothetical protein [Bacilli bacterium]